MVMVMKRKGLKRKNMGTVMATRIQNLKKSLTATTVTKTQNHNQSNTDMATVNQSKNHMVTAMVLILYKEQRPKSTGTVTPTATVTSKNAPK